MIEYYPNIRDLVIWFEGLAAFIAIIYYNKVKETYWKWFVFYLVFIFAQELFWLNNETFGPIRKQDYYAFIGIPIQYLFFYWLYLYNSIKKKTMYFIFTFIYIIVGVIVALMNEKVKVIDPVNLTLGTILLSVCVVLEYYKQITKDEILDFATNKMFYINLGIVLFYIGTYPFFSFYYQLHSTPSYIKIWNAYYLYSLLANIIMYILFAASFIWGKTK